MFYEDSILSSQNIYILCERSSSPCRQLFRSETSQLRRRKISFHVPLVSKQKPFHKDREPKERDLFLSGEEALKMLSKRPNFCAAVRRRLFTTKITFGSSYETIAIFIRRL